MFFASGCVTHTRLKSVTIPQMTSQPQAEIGVSKTLLSAQVGEELHLGIEWLGFEVGSAVIKVEGIEKIGERDAYHISVHVRSNRLIDMVYPVRDEHHSYIDTEHFYSLRYEQILNEGTYRADEVMEYDQVDHKALYHSRRNGSKKRMLIPENVQDQLSAAFWLRAQAMKPGDTIYVPVNADEKNWKLEVKVLGAEKKEIGDMGSFETLEIEPRAQFQGIFVRRGKFRGWMSRDEKRLPLLMQTKIPVLGSINIVLKDYSPR